MMKPHEIVKIVAKRAIIDGNIMGVTESCTLADLVAGSISGYHERQPDGWYVLRSGGKLDTRTASGIAITRGLPPGSRFKIKTDGNNVHADSMYWIQFPGVDYSFAI